MANFLCTVYPICLRPNMEDHLSWTLSKNGIFLVKSARDAQWLNKLVPDHIWTNIWKLHLPSKVVFFVWTMIKGRIPTIDLLQK